MIQYRKNITKAVATMALVASVATPGLSFAQSASSTSPSTSVKAFCANVDAFAQKINTKLTEKQTSYDEKKQERIDKINTKQSEREAALEKKRGEWDGKRLEAFTKVEVKATTDAQKQAVTVYENTVKQAVSTKRASVDSAISTFNTGVSSLITSRKSAVDGLIATFSASVTAATNLVKTECAGGVSSADARAHLETAVKAARATLKSSVAALPKVKISIQQLATARKATVTTAESTFKTTVEQAKATLKVAFGK